MTKDIKKKVEEVEEVEEVEDYPTESHEELRNKLVSSAIDDCNIIVNSLIKLKETRSLNINEIVALYDVYIRLSEIFSIYGTDKQDALKYIDKAIEIGSNKLDITLIAKGLMLRSQIKLNLSNLI